MTDWISGIRQFLGYAIFRGESTTITVGTILTIVVSLIVVSLLLKVVYRVMTRRLPEGDRNKFVSIFSFLRYLFYIVVVIIVLSSAGVDLTVLLTASAALFVGLGFALQYLFQDIISGIMIITDQSLHVGDIIEVEGKVGRVFEIRLRTTRALTRDDKVIVIPNHLFITNSIYNYTQNHKTTRESISIGVAYGSDVELVTRLLTQVTTAERQVLKNPKPFVLFDDFGDSALMFSVHFYLNNSFEAPRVKSRIRYGINKIFGENGVSIPFPQRDVHLFQARPLEYRNVSSNNV